MVPADGIEVDKIDYMVWVPLSSKKPLSHNGSSSTVSPKRGSILAISIAPRSLAGLKNRSANVHMRAAIGSL
jgi:hypothetical protein